MERGRDTDVQCSGRGGSVCLLLCSTWIHPFLSAFHSHSLARSLCHCHARALSFFSPFSSLRSSPFHPRSFFFSPPPSSRAITPLPPLTFVQLLSLRASIPPSSACVLFFLATLFALVPLSCLHHHHHPQSGPLQSLKISCIVCINMYG